MRRTGNDRDVDAFLEYHHRRQSYENDLRQHENTLKKSRSWSAAPAYSFFAFLPDGVPLCYTYQGERSELFNTKYVIVRKQGEVVIQSPSSAPS